MEKSSTSEGGDGAGDVVIPRKRRRTGEKEQRTRHALPVECIICKKSKWIQPPYGPRKKEPLTNCEYEKGGQRLLNYSMMNPSFLIFKIKTWWQSKSGITDHATRITSRRLAVYRLVSLQ
ncbi:uncharacterized protein LOC119745928 [Patiria miniata]|uniref:Uncharacterized protein n=1 Tax=Patiria miniata TaxID=46514 RepID=A0A914AE42_PATMI|nr:uncharacterized protein LOC119732522 [Patiria miniata]XP_038078536.1 uncharacterized protein LOC119745928 [Patiria miniata]